MYSSSSLWRRLGEYSQSGALTRSKQIAAQESNKSLFFFVFFTYWQLWKHTASSLGCIKRRLWKVWNAQRRVRSLDGNNERSHRLACGEKKTFGEELKDLQNPSKNNANEEILLFNSLVKSCESVNGNGRWMFFLFLFRGNESAQGSRIFVRST